MEEFVKGIPSFLAQAGVAGFVLWYYLTRIVPALDRFKTEAWHELSNLRADIRKLEEATDRATKADLLRLIASPLVADVVKDHARLIIDDADSATRSRDDDVKREAAMRAAAAAAPKP